ncbi:MAG: CHAT domain-containing protein, partial [Chloroflexi bacterium]|nr:CHAT domain-containing protein [Chloroflexota bacterium]
RQALDGETLRWLEAQGYVVDVEKRAQLLASSFAAWLAEYFGLKRHRAKEGQPADVEVTLLCVGAPPSPHGVPAGQQKGPLAIRTMFRGRGARIVSAEKELHEDDRRTFVEGLSQCLNHLLHPLQYPDPGWLHSPEQAGSYILTQFATSEIKKYLQDPPPHCTISFEVDDALKDIPWELMLETAYTGEIPFRVGRRIFGQQPANICSPVCGPGKVKALLIGDPGGNLPEAQEEVLDLAERLSCDGRFEPPDVLLGPARCQPGAIALALGSRQYGLIHYAGHTHYDGYRSAWQLAGGKLLTTDRLTSALQMGPPALVFSSSCQSAVGAEPQPIRYENQTFDLPSAFLQAGVEAYIGTLWEVESAAARYFVEAFYEALLCGTHNLGECLRRAKWARKQDEERQDDINWLSFILYGDPHLMPGELFPVMCKP